MSFLLAVTGGFASGIFLRSFFYIFLPTLAFLVILSLLCTGTFLFTRRISYLLGALALVAAVAGVIRVDVADTPLPSLFEQDVKQRVSYEGIVALDPDVRETSKRITVRVTRGDDTTRILAIVPLSVQTEVGDRVRIYGTLQAPQPFEGEGGRIFAYDKYLEVRGIRFLMRYGSLQVIEPAPWHSVPAFFARIKHSFLQGLEKALPSPESALAGGIVIGGKTALPQTIQDEFIIAGLIQIVVLSGYNVMIVAEWVMALFAYLKIPLGWRAPAGAAALLLLVAIAGLTATAIRAALMALIALYARATTRSYQAGRALLLVIVLMLLWNPLYLVFDPGFGLSVVATAGLIWLAPLIEARLTRVWEGFWRNALSTTLAAQVAVTPLLLYHMGLLSWVAIPANLLAAGLVPLAMGFSALAGIVGVMTAALPGIATVVGFPALFLTYLLIEIAHLAARVPFGAVTIGAFPFWLVLAAYATLIYITFVNRSSITPQFTFAKNAPM